MVVRPCGHHSAPMCQCPVVLQGWAPVCDRCGPHCFTTQAAMTDGTSCTITIESGHPNAEPAISSQQINGILVTTTSSAVVMTRIPNPGNTPHNTPVSTPANTPANPPSNGSTENAAHHSGHTGLGTETHTRLHHQVPLADASAVLRRPRVQNRVVLREVPERQRLEFINHPLRIVRNWERRTGLRVIDCVPPHMRTRSM